MSAEKIIERICSVVGEENRNQLSQEIGKALSTIAGWIERDKVPMDVLHKIANDYSIDVNCLINNVRKNEYNMNSGYWITRISHDASAGTSCDIEGIEVYDTNEKMFLPSTFFKNIIEQNT